MASTVEIGNAGEQAVVAYLKDEKGYQNILLDTKQPGATDINAIGNKVQLLIQVKTAVHPGVPAHLNEEEEKAIVSRASAKGAQAWEARVVLDHNLQVKKGGIEFRLLS